MCNDNQPTNQPTKHIHIHIYWAIRNPKSNLRNDGIITINFQNLIIIWCIFTHWQTHRRKAFSDASDWRFTISHDRSYHLCAVWYCVSHLSYIDIWWNRARNPSYPKVFAFRSEIVHCLWSCMCVSSAFSRLFFGVYLVNAHRMSVKCGRNNRYTCHKLSR